MEDNSIIDYKNHFDNGPIPGWVVDADTMQFLEVNNAAVVNYGYSKQEFGTMTIKDIMPTEEIVSMTEKFNNRHSDYYGTGYSRHKKKDGTVFYVHIYSQSTQFGGKRAQLCFAVDINDKVLAEEKNIELLQLQKEQAEELNDILTSLDEAIWSRSADTLNLIYGNKAYYDMYGFDKDSLNADIEFIVQSTYPPDRHLVKDAIKQARKGGLSDIIFRHVNKDGSLRTLKVRLSYKKGKNNKPDIITGVSTDITQEKELFDAMRNNEQKLLATINNTNDLIWSVDKELRITYCNRAFQDFILKRSGVALDEGDYVLGNWHSESFILRRKKDYERALNGDSFNTVVVETINGAEQYTEISSNPIMDHDGKIIGVNCIARDISSARMQLISIREQNEKLKEITRIKAQKIKEQLHAIIQSSTDIHPGSQRDIPTKSIPDQLKSATHELDHIIKELTGVTMNIDTYFPDTEDIIARL